MLTLPGVTTQINRQDGFGWTPLAYAIRAFPEAVEAILRAGASLRAVSSALHQQGPRQWKAISALIRAGYPTDERDTENFGRTPLHDVPADRQPRYRHVLEIMRHGSHLIDWNACDDDGATPLDYAAYWAEAAPDNEQLQLIHALYRTQQIPPHAQYISSFDGEQLMSAEEASERPCVSLIDVAITGPVQEIGRVLAAGAMANERDKEGRTLLHLIAMGGHVPNGYSVALELERHARYGIDHDAMYDGKTAFDIAVATLSKTNLSEDTRREMTSITAYLADPCLPVDEQYLFPCMDPKYCDECVSLRCMCPENDVPGMPGSFV